MTSQAIRILLATFSLFALAGVSSLFAHTTDSSGAPMDKEALRQHILDEFMAKRKDLAKEEEPEDVVSRLPERTEVAAGFSAFDLVAFLSGMPTLPPPGYGLTMAESFGLVKPVTRTYWDSNYFYIETNGMPDRSLIPAPMVGITAWQQQIPLPVAYFADTTNPEGDAGSLGFGEPNVWKLPLVPLTASSPFEF